MAPSGPLRSKKFQKKPDDFLLWADSFSLHLFLWILEYYVAGIGNMYKYIFLFFKNDNFLHKIYVLEWWAEVNFRWGGTREGTILNNA